MKYADILPDVLAGKWVRDYDNRQWSRMKSDGSFEYIFEGKAEEWKPCRAHYEKDTWEVKPSEIYCRKNQSFNVQWQECEKSEATHKLVPVEKISSIPSTLEVVKPQATRLE